jgi:hypothetical protein
MGKHSSPRGEKSAGSVVINSRGKLVSFPVTQRMGVRLTNRRRTTRNVGAAAGGLLGLAFLPLAVAFADDYQIDPTGTETITGIYGTGVFGAFVTPPALEGSVQGDQLFDYTDTTTGTSGTFMGDESAVTDGFGDTGEEVLVTSSPTGTDAPPVGSVFDTSIFGYGSGETIYSATPTVGGADTISETTVTPFGDYTVPVAFDAADVPVADATGVPLGDGDDFVPVGASTITAINGDPPLTMDIQGDQTFNVDNAAGANVGSFGADETTTSDGLGTYTEAVLVTSDSGTAGTAAGDVPPVGSIFNTVNYAGIENIYSDLTSATGGADTISDTVVTPLGDFSIPVTFDAAAAETPVSVDLPDGEDIVLDPHPSTPDLITGINGLPPGDVAVQGQDLFDLDQGTTVLGKFEADATKTVDSLGDTTQTLLVTKDLLGDSLPKGSVIETVLLGNGFENIYTDLASATPGADVISDTLVTPFGDIPIAVDLDVSAGLATDMFQILGSL